MRNPYKTILLSSICCLLAASACGEKDKHPPEAELLLTVSTKEILLDLDKGNEEALTLSWNRVFESENPNTIHYLLEIDKKGNMFGDPMAVFIGRSEEYAYSFTHKAFYSLLKDKAMAVGQTIIYEVRLIADCQKGNSPLLISNVAEFQITLNEQTGKGSSLNDYKNENF